MIITALYIYACIIKDKEIDLITIFFTFIGDLILVSEIGAYMMSI